MRRVVRVGAWLGVALVVLILGVSAYLAYAAGVFSDREGAIDDVVGPVVPPVPPADPLDLFRSSWDSEGNPDWPVAEVLASMSEAAYSTEVEAKAVFGKAGFAEAATFADGNTVCYVVSAGDVAVVVFRGTDDTQDWFTNLNRFSRDTPHGQIHRGFYDAYQPLKRKIAALLRERDPGHVWITGHSLGGALAVVCAYDLVENQKLGVSGVVTFGQPMVARRPLAEHLDELLLGRYVRFVNEADTVPKVPVSHWPCGRLVWFHEGKIKRSPPKRPAYADPGSFGASEPGDTSSEEYAEISPLSEAEFETEKAKIRQEDAASEALPSGETTYEGNYHWIYDHSMTFYLDKVGGLLRPSPSD